MTKNSAKNKLREYSQFLEGQIEEHASNLRKDHKGSLETQLKGEQRAFENMASNEAGQTSAYRQARAKLYELFPDLRPK